jgi:tRNA-splicing ligase RtcB
MTAPAIFGTHDEKTLAQLADVASRAKRAALMADGHLGYIMPIGGVAAYDNQVSVVGVGFDIACGNAAILTDATMSDIVTNREDAETLNQIADDIQRSISFGVGRTNNHDDPTLKEHALFDSPAWDAMPKSGNKQNLQGKARAQLGTVGSGNHYVDVFRDEQDRIWVGVHFGSRGLGHTIASGFLAMSQGAEWGARVPEREALLDLNTPMGDGYWALMNLAGDYAYAGREWVARKVVEILGAKELDLVHNHHNFAWKEEIHEGDKRCCCPQGRNASVPRTAWIRWWLDGRRQRDPARHRGHSGRRRRKLDQSDDTKRACYGFDRPRRWSRDVTDAGRRQEQGLGQEAPSHRSRLDLARDAGRVAPEEGCHPARRRTG